jgi:hypothetical protein
MKYIHHELLQRWVENTDLFIEVQDPKELTWSITDPYCVLDDTTGTYKFRVSDLITVWSE